MKTAKLPKPKAIVFDWDNTLVDSWPIIYTAMKETFEHMGTTPWSLEETKSKVGKSLRDHFPSLFGERWQEAGEIYSQSYRNKHLEELQALPLAKELLIYLQSKDLYLVVVSNKQGPILRKEAEHMGLSDYFDKLVGAHDAPRDKPFPDPVILALKDSGINPGENVWFIGDSITDVETALNTGCTPIFYGDAKLPDEVKNKVFYITDHGHLQKVLNDHC